MITGISVATDFSLVVQGKNTGGVGTRRRLINFGQLLFLLLLHQGSRKTNDPTLPTFFGIPVFNVIWS